MMKVTNHLSKVSKQPKDIGFDSVVKKYSAAYQEEEKRIANKQNEIKLDPALFSKIKEKMAGIRKEESKDEPIISNYDIYRTMKDLASSHIENKGISALAFHLKSKWENEPLGYCTLSDVESLNKVAERLLPKKIFTRSANAVKDTINRIIKSSIKNRFDLRKLDKIAEHINSQDEYIIAVELQGFSLDRPDMEELRNYIAYKVNTRAGKEVVSSTAFKSSEQVKRTLDKLSGNTAEFNLDLLKGITGEDWSATQATMKAEKVAKEVFQDMPSAKEVKTMKLAVALDKSNVAYQTNTREGKNYIARKDGFGKYHLYSRTGSSDAILLGTFKTFEDLSDNVSPLKDSWEI